MGTQMTKPQAQPDKGVSLIRVAAAEYNMEPAAFAETVKVTIFPTGKATNEQLAAFLAVAHEYKLNPFLKEIFAFPTKSGGVMPIVSIDGWLKIITRHPEFDWMDFAEEVSEDGKPFSYTCTIKRKDRERPTVVTEYYAECKRNTEPWNQMPHRMMRHKSVKECGRVAFGFSGIQDEDEARDAVQRVDAEAKPAIPAVTRRSIQAAAPAQPEPIAANPDADPAPVHGIPADDFFA